MSTQWVNSEVMDGIHKFVSLTQYNIVFKYISYIYT